MTRKSHALNNQQLHNPNIVENKSREEKCVHRVNQSKKKKNKSKNRQKELFKNRKVNDINLQVDNSTRTFNENKPNRYGWKENKELKKPAAVEIKSGGFENNFEKTADISQKKNRKHQNSIDTHKSADITSATERTPYVYKKRIVKQSAERQYSERRSETNSLSNNDDRLNVHNTPKEHNHNVLYKNDNDKNYQNNRQLKNEKSNEQSEKHIRVVKYINDSYKTNQLSNANFFKPQNNVEEILPGEDIKTMIINNRGAKYTKGKKYHYVKEPEPMQNYNERNIIIDKYNKHNWDFHSHNGQNTYSINNNTLNKTDKSRRNKQNIKSIESAIIESSQKSNFEQKLTSAGSRYSDLKMTKDQRFRSDAMMIDIHLNAATLSDSTFIHTDQDKSHDERQKILAYEETFSLTCGNQTCLKNNNSKSPSIYEKHNSEDNIMSMYNLKCTESKTEFTEKNWTTQINSDNTYKEFNQYSNIENERNNHYQNTQNIINVDHFIEYFDKIWEGVIREISGY